MQEIGDRLFDIVLAIGPAVVVFLTAYFMLKKYLENDEAKRNREERQRHRKHTLPLRLQAYERVVLFLERINPNSMVMRVHKSGMSARLLQTELLQNIRNEFEHNITQQIYISTGAWDMAKKAKEETIKLINVAATKVQPDASGIDMSKAVFEICGTLEHLPTDIAINAIKDESRKLF